MTSRLRLLLGFLAPLAVFAAVAAYAQTALVEGNVAETRRALADARKQGAAARSRAERLEEEAARVTAAADRTAREAAAIAALVARVW